MHLRKENIESIALFLSTPAWQDIKRCLMARRPAGAAPEDQPHVAAAKGFKRDAWEQAIMEVEKLPTDLAEETPKDPFDRPATYPSD